MKKPAKKKQQRRGPSKFRKTEASRLVRAALAAGLPIARVEVDPATGKISVVAGAAEADSPNDLDQWMKKRERHDAG